jgi:hypothetical protein
MNVEQHAATKQLDAEGPETAPTLGEAAMI